MKLKEIRPLHLDDKLQSMQDVKNKAKVAKQRHVLRFYDNRPLKRLTSLLLRTT